MTLIEVNDFLLIFLEYQEFLTLPKGEEPVPVIF